MACYFCTHFVEGEKPKYRPGGNAVKEITAHVGECALNPARIRVTGLHYCSQLNVRDASMVGYWWRHMHEYGNELTEQRKEIRKLKDRKKLLNQQLRAARRKDKPE